jgi:quercetin dioxygenase-like cupin family protein
MMIRKVNKVWGNEEWIVNNDKYCGKILNLRRGFRSSIHYHKNKHETFYVDSGRVLLELEGLGIKVLETGTIQEIKPNQKHRFTGLEDSRIFEFSTTHDDSDSYRITKSEKVNLETLGELLK